jgi:hypothetical protein
MARRKTPQTTPLAIVGRRLAQLRREIERFDTPGADAFDHPAFRAAVNEQEALIEQAMGLQPVTLQDAATLALCISEQVGLVGFDMPRDEAQPIYERIETATAGILLVFRNMGLPLADLGPIEADYEISRHRFMPPLARQAHEERSADA